MYDNLIESLRLCVKYGKAQDALENAEPAADAIEELSKPRWIPVTERLPEKYEVVIALNKRGKQHDIDKAYWNGFRFFRHYRKAPYSNVTHWMPLPKPPKEE